MEMRLEQSRGLRGSIRVPGDKSIAHRALLLGAIANGWTRIAGVPRSADVSATIRALGACGVRIQRNEDVAIVNGGGREALHAGGEIIDCANSGTTMRLLMGVLSSHAGTVRLTGDASLTRRPMRRIAEPLARMGATVSLSGDGVAPLDLTGSTSLQAIDYELPVASAQLKSALLLAALAAAGRTRLRGKLDSRDHTERMLPRFGARLEVRGNEITVEGGQRLRGAFVEIPGDPSSAAVWIAAALVTAESDITVHDVSLNPTRTGFLDVVRRMGADVETVLRRSEPEPIGSVRVRSGALTGVRIGAHEVPAIIDELPLLAVLATQAHGKTEVRGAAELRVKESDRIDAIADTLSAMGARVETFDDGFAIEGPQPLRGALVDPQDDHRIAMAAAVASLAARGTTTIFDAECVGVSYPSFFSTLQTARGEK
ncbi:MAG TPA: 3-phosphoshikimate 1-carboxyvinyltransferase [Candidatus Baltobacteraceae bacterium]|nr:3-phosphoshikimate 1-carboxyvinyltransferase [Candidatus Baltobacteraceae bacterium]